MAEAQAVNTNPFRDIFEQYVDEASFLWLLRSVALEQPHYLPSELSELEQRIENNLNGLFTSPDDVWEICENALELEEPGEVFTSAIFAFRSLEAEKIQKVVQIGLTNDETFKGLVSAIAWLPENISTPWIEKFIRSKDLDHKYLAIAALSALRKDPGEYLLTILKRDDCLAHEKLYARCMRLVGELKRKDLVPALNAGMDSESERVAFWARWSGILLGNRAVVKDLEPLITEEGPYQQKALQLFFRTAPLDYAKSIISTLAKDSSQTRNVIKACAALGDPQVVPWIISTMDQPEHARVAGEAFTQITGIHLEENNLDVDVPELPEVPNDDPEDEFVGLDEDENLVWPDVAKLKVVWQKYGSQYVAGRRYFLGKQIGIEHLKNQFDSGFQRHRIAASLELALQSGAVPVQNFKARIAGE